MIVVDEYFIADDPQGFAAAGFEIIGPASSLADARVLAEQRQIDGAVLDFNFDGEKVYPLANALIERGVPIVFVTGYDPSVLPSRFAGVQFCVKPVDAKNVIEALERAVTE